MNVHSDPTSLELGMNNLSLRNNPTYMAPPYNQTPSFSGEWAQGLFRDNDEDDEEDDQPLSYARQSTNYTRPVSIRNMANNVQSARHPNFIKPALQSIAQTGLIPADMGMIQSLYEYYSQKVYYEGYMYKKNDLTVDGKSFGDHRWTKWYVELCGPVLTMWDAESEDENVMPQYINIADSFLDLIAPQDNRQHIFSLNTSGANRYLIDAIDHNCLLEWIQAIRLSCFECTKIHEIYTLAFLSRPVYVDILAKQMNKMEGYVQVRFSNSTEWQKFWVVVSDKKDKKLFGKKSAPSKGQMMFYESKKSKAPVLTMSNVVQAYTVYPESPQMIDYATMFKIEGSTSRNSHDEYCNALIMASTSRELVQWIIGSYDAFKLYGRPSSLLSDPANPKSLNFGVSHHHDNPRLFLDLPEITQINVQEGLQENKTSFVSILQQKLSSAESSAPPSLYQPSSGIIHQIPSPSAGIIHNVSSNSSLVSHPQRSTLAAPVPSTQRATTPTGRVIYASDEDSGDEDYNESDSDEGSFDKEIKKEMTLPIQVEDDGFADSILMGITPKKTQKEKEKDPQSISASASASASASEHSKHSKDKSPAVTDHEDSTDESELDNTDEEEERRNPRQGPATTARPKPKATKTQISLSGSEDEDITDDEDIHSSGSEDDDDVPINQTKYNNDNGYNSQYMMTQEMFDTLDPYTQQQWRTGMMTQETFDTMDPFMQQQYLLQQQQQQQQQQQGYYGEYDANGYLMENEDGPIIPQLGDRFATQNSLLDTFRPDHPSARDQEGYARATGQPLIQVPNKPPEPRAGLVGMISQIEYEKKQKESKNRLLDMEKDRILERERERYLLEQRYQMMQPMMMQNQMAMMDPSMMQSQMSLMDPRMMMNMPMMTGQMPMMNMMGQPMMYPNMMQNPMMQNPMMQNPMMQNPMMQNPMMQSPMMQNPMMNMAGMNPMMMNPYSQYPMWNQQAAFGNTRFNGQIPEDDDEDDDVPLGAKEVPRPS